MNLSSAGLILCGARCSRVFIYTRCMRLCHQGKGLDFFVLFVATNIGPNCFRAELRFSAIYIKESPVNPGRGRSWGI